MALLGRIYFNAVFGALGGLLGWMLFGVPLPEGIEQVPLTPPRAAVPVAPPEAKPPTTP